MSLEIEGTVVKILPELTGEGKNGTWIKQEFVIETAGEYPKKVCLESWGDRTRTVKTLKEGEKITVSFEPSSREFNERWFTNLRAWKIDKAGGGGAKPTPEAPPPAFDNETPPPPTEENDLPF